LIDAIQEYPVGTACRVVFSLADGDLAIAARVIRVESGALALVFVAVSDADRNRLVRVLRQAEQELRRSGKK
jgi:hypothetical protein